MDNNGGTSGPASSYDPNAHYSSRFVDELSQVASIFVRKKRRGLIRADSGGATAMSCLELVFGYLRPKDLARVACVSRRWNKAAYNEGLWEEICKKRWPSIRSPSLVETVQQGGGFRNFYRRRVIGPAKPSQPNFELDDVTFFLDVSLHGHIMISHAFKYSGGSARIEFSSDSFVDEKTVIPPLHALDLEEFRRMLDINLCAIRVSDSKGVSLLKGNPNRCGQGLIDHEAKEPQKAVKINFHTSLGGQLSHVFYGMLNLVFSFPIKPKILQKDETPCGLTHASTYGEGSTLVKVGGMVLEITALKDRLGGTVKVHIAGEEFLMLLSSLNWD